MATKKTDQNTEEIIMDAAKEIFQQKGMDGTRMQEIADKAGINKAMLHYYYRSKDLLFEAVFNKAFALLAPRISKILNDETLTIEEKIRDFTYNYTSFISKHPYIPDFVFHEMSRNPGFLDKIRKAKGFPSLEKFNRQVAEEVEKGILKPIEGDQLFINLVSLNLFPFIASPLIKGVLKADDKDFKQLIELRKTAVADFIISSIKK